MSDTSAVTPGFHRIPPRSARAFEMETGDLLEIVDPEGEQVADLVAFQRDDLFEHLSSGRSLDYAAKLWLSTGNLLYSNRSRPMLAIERDDVGRHDFLLTPCSRDTFRIIYGDATPPTGCEEHLVHALQPWGIDRDRIPVCFNVFMHVDVDPASGALAVLPPRSRAGDRIVLRAMMPLVVGITACSAGQSNNFRFKPIDFRLLRDVDGGAPVGPRGLG